MVVTAAKKAKVKKTLSLADIEVLRGLVNCFISNNLSKSLIFWIQKLYSVSKGLSFAHWKIL